MLETESLETKLVKAFKKGELKHPHPRERIDEAEQSGLISAEEATALRKAWELVAEVVRVDEFTTDEMAAGRSEFARSNPHESGSKPAPNRKRTRAKAASSKSKTSTRKPAASASRTKATAAKASGTKPASRKSAKATPESETS